MLGEGQYYKEQIQTKQKTRIRNIQEMRREIANVVNIQIRHKELEKVISEQQAKIHQLEQQTEMLKQVQLNSKLLIKDLEVIDIVSKIFVKNDPGLFDLEKIKEVVRNGQQCDLVEMINKQQIQQRINEKNR